MSDAVVGAVWGLGAVIVVLYALQLKRQRDQRAALGGDVVDYLTQLQPRIDAPVIRVAPPTLRL